MAKLALVVLTHADPAQLRRLLTALPEPDVFVHVDRKVPTDVMARFAEVASERVRLVERVDSRLGSWSLVVRSSPAWRRPSTTRRQPT